MNKRLKNLLLMLRGKKCHSLNDVFTPTSAAHINYIARPSIESILNRDLRTPGLQIIMYGHSGSGKTSLARNLSKDKKQKIVFTQCTTNSTFDSLILNAFDQLNPYYVSEKSKTFSKSVSSSSETEYRNIKSSIEGSLSSERSETQVRFLPVQLTPQKLATLMSIKDVIWVVEDFHKLPNNEKQYMADTLKIFADSSAYSKVSKIICIGVCDSADELLRYDANLSNRVSQINVPLLSEAEIKEIINKGCNLLNVSMDGQLVNQIVSFSNQLGAVAHQMCCDICNSNNILETQLRKVNIDDSKFNDAIQSYVQRNSDTLRRVYESASKNSVGWYILKTFSIEGNDKISFDEIKYKIKAKQRGFTNTEIKNKLDELSSEAYDVIRFDINSEKYYLSSPFWGAFLKMQFQLEDENRRSKNKYRPFLSNQREPEAILYNSILKAIEELNRLKAS